MNITQQQLSYFIFSLLHIVMYCLLRLKILIILDAKNLSNIFVEKTMERNSIFHTVYIIYVYIIYVIYSIMFRSWRIILMRIFVNVAVLSLLALSVYAVIKVVERSTTESRNWWRQNEITIVMSLITNLFPILFEILGFFESYHPRKQLRIQLAR